MAFNIFRQAAIGANDGIFQDLTQSLDYWQIGGHRVHFSSYSV